MTGLRRFFGFDLCLKLKRLDWATRDAERMLNALLKDGR